MEHTHAHLAANSSLSCGLGFVPVVYYSLLLCLGLPGEGHGREGAREGGKPGAPRGHAALPRTPGTPVSLPVRSLAPL